MKEWVYAPRLAPGKKVPAQIIDEVTRRAQALVEEWRPLAIEKPPKGHQFNHRVDVYAKWRGKYFYFCSTYACPGPRALSPSFEAYFTRMEYVENNLFNLAYMRHTGKWWETIRGLTLDEVLGTIREDSLDHP